MGLFQYVEDYTMKKLTKPIDNFNLKDSLMKRICLQLRSTSNNQMADTIATVTTCTNMNVDTLSDSKKKKKKKTNKKLMIMERNQLLML